MSFSSKDHVLSVARLHKTETVRDVILGKTYHAFFRAGKAFLNENVVATVVNAKDLDNQKQGPVKIKRISGFEIQVEFVKGRSESEPNAMALADISTQDIDKKFWIQGKIEKIQQTGGPTLFLVSDGSATLNLKGFVGAGKRAYPEILEGDVISAQVQILEHEGVLEGEIVSVKKLSEHEKTVFAQKLQAVIQQRIQPVQRPFLISSPVLEKLKPEFEKAVRLIKLAVVDNRPIVLKHHADTDGYSAAIALERAILPLVSEQHSDEKALWHYYVRTPSKSPYYDYYDATKDISMALSDMAKFNDKMPLIIIVDTGSGPENELPIQLVKLFKCPVIVIDHHFFDEDPVSPIVDVHINPHLVGSQTDFSAGMLCVEIARLVSQKAENIDYIAAMAGLADRIESSELDQYLQIAQKQGYSKEYLQQLATVIDFEAWTFKFSESRELVDFLFGNDSVKQKELCELLYPKVQKMMQRQLEISKQFVRKENSGNVLLAMIDVENSSNFNTYPNPGKAVGNLHDGLQKESPGKPVLTVGFGKDFITLRATDGTNFSVSEFVKQSIHAIPNGGIEGGGHEHAGSLRFVPAVRDQMLEKLRNYLKEKNR